MDIVGITPEDYARIRRAVRRSEGTPMAGGQPGLQLRDRNYTRISFRNDASETVPAYGVMRVTGTDLDDDDAPFWTVAKPDTSFNRLYLVNGTEDVLEDGFGWGTWLWHADWVLYDDANTPAFGESWGPQNNSWELKKYRYGFTIQGSPTGSTTDRVLAVQHEVNGFIGKTDASHAKSATGTISVYDGNRADTSINVTGVYNLFAAVATTKFVDVEWRGGTWFLTSAECA